MGTSSKVPCLYCLQLLPPGEDVLPITVFYEFVQCSSSLSIPPWWSAIMLCIVYSSVHLTDTWTCTFYSEAKTRATPWLLTGHWILMFKPGLWVSDTLPSNLHEAHSSTSSSHPSSTLRLHTCVMWLKCLILDSAESSVYFVLTFQYCILLKCKTTKVNSLKGHRLFRKIVVMLSLILIHFIIFKCSETSLIIYTSFIMSWNKLSHSSSLASGNLSLT